MGGFKVVGLSKISRVFEYGNKYKVQKIITVMKGRKKVPKRLEIFLAMAFGLGASGSVLGLESNIQPFNLEI